MLKPLTVALALLVWHSGAPIQQPHSYVPPKGFVPDSLTAVRIAVAVWGPIYGESQIQSEAPFRAVLHGGVWTITGTLPPGMVGGVAIAELAKSDARVLRVSHGK